MKIKILKIIKEQKEFVNNPENKLINKKYKLMDNIVKQSIVSYVKSNIDIYKHYNFMYKTQIHTLDTVISEIIDFFKFAKSYRSSSILPKSTLYDHVEKLSKLNVLKGTYIDLLDTYLVKTPAKKLKQRYTDTTFIVNKYGTESIGYSGKYKRTGSKVSLDTEKNGVVLRDYVAPGNVNDAKIYIEQYNNDYYSDKVKKYNKILIADPGYDSSLIKDKCREDNIKPIIKYNKRKCKDENIIKSNKFDDETFELYKTRFSIENTNGLIKSIRRVQTRYDRTVRHFKLSLLYSYIDHIIKIITKEKI